MLDGSTNYTLSRARTELLLRTTLRIGLFRERNQGLNRKASCDQCLSQKPFSAYETVRTVFSVHDLGEVGTSVLGLPVKELKFFAKIEVEEVEI